MNPQPESDRQSELLKRFRQQQEGTEQPEYPEGRIADDDEGALVCIVRGDAEKNLVIIDYGKEVKWMAMPPQHAVEFAQMLIKQARAISKEPLSVVL